MSAPPITYWFHLYTCTAYKIKNSTPRRYRRPSCQKQGVWHCNHLPHTHTPA